jgi:hypothetical protein
VNLAVLLRIRLEPEIPLPAQEHVPSSNLGVEWGGGTSLVHAFGSVAEVFSDAFASEHGRTFMVPAVFQFFRATSGSRARQVPQAISKPPLATGVLLYLPIGL